VKITEGSLNLVAKIRNGKKLLLANDIRNSPVLNSQDKIKLLYELLTTTEISPRSNRTEPNS
jgi:hypothetical protein